MWEQNMYIEILQCRRYHYASVWGPLTYFMYAVTCCTHDLFSTDTTILWVSLYELFVWRSALYFENRTGTDYTVIWNRFDSWSHLQLLCINWVYSVLMLESIVTLLITVERFVFNMFHNSNAMLIVFARWVYWLT